MLEKTFVSPLDCKEMKSVNPKGNQSWIFTGRNDVGAETPILWPPDATHWKRPWCWERLKAKGEEGGRGWDISIASLTQWTWIWENSGKGWTTESPGMLQSMGSQRATTASSLPWGISRSREAGDGRTPGLKLSKHCSHKPDNLCWPWWDCAFPAHPNVTDRQGC